MSPLYLELFGYFYLSTVPHNVTYEFRSSFIPIGKKNTKQNVKSENNLSTIANKMHSDPKKWNRKEAHDGETPSVIVSPGFFLLFIKY